MISDKTPTEAAYLSHQLDGVRAAYSELLAENDKLKEQLREMAAALETFINAFEGPACCEAKSAMGHDAMPRLLTAGERARALLARVTAELSEAKAAQERGWLRHKLVTHGDIGDAPESCLLCGRVGERAVWNLEVPRIYVCIGCQLAERRLAECQEDAGRWREYIGKPDVFIAAFENAPCFICGYNGPNYYQPSAHKCAEKYHSIMNELTDAALKEPK